MSSKFVPPKKSCYVYALLDPRKSGSYSYSLSSGTVTFDHEPFYIGKGTRDRAYDHVPEALRMKKPKGYKDRKIQRIVRDGYDVIVQLGRHRYTEARAYELERELITTIGRYNLRAGPLTNATDGGLGGVNVDPEVRKLWSKQHKEWWANLTKKARRAYTDRQRKVQTERWANVSEEDRLEHGAKIQCTKAQYSPERRAKYISAKSEGAKKWYASLTEEQRTEMKRKQDRAKANYKPKSCPHCGFTGKGGNMRRYHFDRCLHVGVAGGPADPWL